ncbi:MAG: hypothetical protein V3R76_09980, partial [Gammaproteobacteria bacterium]
GFCGGEVELNAQLSFLGTSAEDVCQPSDGAAVRPLMTNKNWGGVGEDFDGTGGTFGAPTQKLEVILTR